MTTWQVDFYRRPLRDEHHQPIWELVVCNSDLSLVSVDYCAQSEATAPWLAAHLQQIATTPLTLPDCIQAFRPQTVNLLEAICPSLGIQLEPKRSVQPLQQLLRQRSQDYSQMPGYTREAYDPLALELPPPNPIPDRLLGERWRFAAIASSDLEPAFRDRPIPIRSMPESIMPLQLGLPSTVQIPGVVIDGGRQSMPLARWIQQNHPFALRYMPGTPDGLLLETGLVDRWVLATFDDPDIKQAAQTYQKRIEHSKGLHFLLVQPDDSGITYTGLWCLQVTP